MSWLRKLLGNPKVNKRKNSRIKWLGEYFREMAESKPMVNRERK